MQLAGRPVSKAPAPRTTLPPTHAAFHGGVGHAIQAAARAPAPAPRSVGRAVQHAAAPAYHPSGARLAGRPGPEQHATGGGSDIQTSGAAYGRAQADAYKKSVAYRRAVVETFLHQPDPQKTAIVQGALQHPSAEGKMVLDAIKSMVPKGAHENLQAGTGKNIDAGPTILAGLEHMFSPKQVIGGGDTLKGSATGNQGAGIPGIGTILPFRGASGAKDVALNTGKDLVDLPAQTISSIGQIGGDIAGGHVGKAVSDLITPYKQLIANPGKSFYSHPLDTYLMAAGPIHGVTRIGAGAVRAATAGDSLAREGVQLAGNLTHERPRYSPYPLIKAGQHAVEKARYTRAPTGELIPRSPSVRARLTGLETSRLVGVNERIRQANRDAAIQARAKAVRPAIVRRVGHGAKTTLKYNPDRSVIPGAGVLARIADGTIRRPETFTQDLEKHVQQVASTRPDLADNPKLLKEHDAYVKQLRNAAGRKLTGPQLARVFDAADRYAKDYKPVESEARKLGQFGSRSEDALLKRTLSHYAVAHMGAKFDQEKGLVDAHGNALSTAQILGHMKSVDGVGGRALAFTSDKPKRGSAFYISSERRPLPEGATNTMFAYQHGLTDPGHEGLLEQHVRMQGVVDAHKAQNRTVNAISVMNKDGRPWPTYKQADAAASPGYKPIALSQPFHPRGSLDKALEGTDPANIEQEAQTHGLDLSQRLTDHGQGRWALADENALKRIEQHKAQITSNLAMRAFKMTNNQFRQVALGTSAKHIPGIIQEGLIRDVASGVGVSSWITGRRVLGKARELNPELGQEARIRLTGGTVAGATKMMMTRQVSDHFLGTNLHGPLKAFEAFMRAPGPRQMRTAWRTWLRFAITGTKRYIEEQNQTAGVGKAVLREFGAQHGPFAKALRLQGAMLDDAAKGLFDDKKLRAFRAQVEHIYGRWTDLTPTGQTALMLSPFGLWWTNSVRWLARSPIDRPVATGAVAAASVGTEKERNAKGLDLFAPNAVPAYMQGGVPLAGGKILAQNYYSPFGVANDAIQTSASLIEPWLQSPLLGSLGDNYLGRQLNSPSNPRGYKNSNPGQRAQYVINSLLASFLPLYSKAETIAQGGSSAYDSSTLLNVQTKTPGKGVGAGIAKAVTPYRMYENKKQSAASSSGTGWGGSTSSGSSSSGGAAGWGGSSTTAAGWG